MSVKNRVVLITGGCGDIGLSCAELFLQEGARVVLVDFNAQALEQALDDERFSPYRERIRSFTANVADLAGMEAAAAYAQEQFGQIDILICAAGILRHYSIEDMPMQAWQDLLDVNLTGVFVSAKAVIPYMKQRGYGRIVNISSIAGRTGRPGAVNYSATKAGVIGLTVQLAYDLGPFGITVNAVAPGPVRGGLMARMSQEEIDDRIAGARIYRLGRLDEVAFGVLSLAADEAGWTTGEVLDINGGLYF